jgi:hypothetical protein
MGEKKSGLLHKDDSSHELNPSPARDNGGVADDDDDDDEVSPRGTRTKRGARRNVAQRPAHRVTLKQQLHERVAERKKAQKAAKKVVRQEAAVVLARAERVSNKKAGKSNGKPEQMAAARGAGKLGEAVVGTRGVGDLIARAMVVEVDNRGEDFSEYRRY